MVSILIVHYNTFDLTYACVESCLKFTKGIAFEIIVVNNGSEEKSLDELIQAFPSVQLIEPGDNVGFAKGNNLGIRAAKGAYILLLNSDCELVEDSVTAAVKALESNQTIGVLTAKLIFPDGEIQNNYQSFPSITGDFLELSRLFKLMNKEKYARKHENRLLNPSHNHFCDWVWGAFFLFRTVDLQLLHGEQLSDRFFMYGEDMEWCWQFSKIEKKAYYFSETTVIHHMGQSNFGNNNKKWRTIVNNEILTNKTFRGTFHTSIFRFVRGFKYAISSIKQRENWMLVKLYFFMSAK